MNYQEKITRRNTSDSFAQNIGLRFVELSEGYAKSVTKMDRTLHHNENGIVHGGVIFTIADTTASGAIDAEDHQLSTLNASINYMRPGNLDGEIVAESRMVKSGRTISVIETDLYSGDTLIANCSINYYISKK